MPDDAQNSPGFDTETVVFEAKRRSNPAAAFADLVEAVRSAAREGELARAVEEFKGRTAFSGDVLSRLAELAEEGVSASAFQVGGLPDFLGPGMALMYDAALEALRSNDRSVDLRRLQPRDGAAVARQAEDLMSHLGAASVAALEMARTNSAFRERLAGRAEELGGVLPGLSDGFTELTGGGPNLQCEHCQIDQEDPPGSGNYTSFCGSVQACNELIIGIIILILVLLIKWIMSWGDDED